MLLGRRCPGICPTVHTSFVSADSPTDVLLQFEAAALPEQTILRDTSAAWAGLRHVPADDDAERVWLSADGHCEIEYRAELKSSDSWRTCPACNRCPRTNCPERRSIPAGQPLLPRGSPFFAQSELDNVRANCMMRDWIHDNFSYTPAPGQTRARSRVSSRDKAFAAIMPMWLWHWRACAILARYVSCYSASAARFPCRCGSFSPTLRSTAAARGRSSMQLAWPILGNGENRRRSRCGGRQLHDHLRRLKSSSGGSRRIECSPLARCAWRW